MLELLQGLSVSAPASTKAIKEVQGAIGMALPSDYLEFLMTSDGAAGLIGDKTYVDIWGAQEVLTRNRALEVDTYAPGLLLFGSDGGGEAFAFDTRLLPWKVVMVPFVVMSWEDSVPFGDSFTEFLQRLFRGEWPL